jgi:hypothetical protein
MDAGGWTLTDAAARIVNVTVNARAGVGRPVRPYVFGGPGIGTIPAATLTVSIAGDVATIGGTVTAGQGVALATNSFTGAGYTALTGDNLAAVATGLAAALTAAGQAATAAGDTVTVPGAAALYANTFVSVGTVQEVQRQIQGFDITIHAPGRDVRDATSAAFKPILDNTIQFTLPDGFAARMLAAPPIEIDDDRPERALMFDRHVYYNVEYATTLQGLAVTQAIIAVPIEDQTGQSPASFVEA